MINIVTMLGSVKNFNSLSAACAKNDIRIAADNFEDAYEFIGAFDSLNMNIDAAVISDEMLKEMDKKDFFETIRASEPNIRIIIVFPGYRNQYIEEQITEYREVYGISDIIYEGMAIDELCFVEVVKKGYIYGYDVNVYDETEEPDPEPVKEQKCITIGVMGLTHGCGTTNMAVSIADYIALSEEIPVKAIDFSGTGHLRFAKSKRVTFIVHSGIDIPRLTRNSKALVYDFGTPYQLSSKGKLISNTDCYSEERMKIFRECDLKICMCFADSWHIGKVKYLLNDRAWKREIDDSYIFLFDTLPVQFKSRHSKINIYGRNDKEIARRVAGLFALKGGG